MNWCSVLAGGGWWSFMELKEVFILLTPFSVYVSRLCVKGSSQELNKEGLSLGLASGTHSSGRQIILAQHHRVFDLEKQMTKQSETREEICKTWKAAKGMTWFVWHPLENKCAKNLSNIYLLAITIHTTKGIGLIGSAAICKKKKGLAVEEANAHGSSYWAKVEKGAVWRSRTCFTLDSRFAAAAWRFSPILWSLQVWLTDWPTEWWLSSRKWCASSWRPSCTPSWRSCWTTPLRPRKRYRLHWLTLFVSGWPSGCDLRGWWVHAQVLGKHRSDTLEARRMCF